MNTSNRLLTLLFTFAILISCNKKNESTFSIQGHISPVKGNSITLLKEIDIERKISKKIKKIPLTKDGNFKAEFNLEPHLYKLQLDKKNSLLLAIDKGQHITIEISDFDTQNPKTIINGSKDSEKLLAYENFRKRSLDTLVQSLRRKVKAIRKSEHPDQEKIKLLQQQEIENYEKHLEELNVFIKDNMMNTLGLYATSIRWKGAENLHIYDSITVAFENTYPDLEIAKKLREKVSRLQQTSIGGITPDIEMNTPEGEAIKLSFVQKKYTLIDFWASWCGPCRSESETLNKLYQQYNSKGFEIYGVSLDDKKDKWVNAIQKDDRTWTNVSSLQGFKTPASYDYAVTALPDNYLIDKDRKIIAKNIHGDELIKLISQLINEAP